MNLENFPKNENISENKPDRKGFLKSLQEKILNISREIAKLPAEVGYRTHDRTIINRANKLTKSLNSNKGSLYFINKEFIPKFEDFLGELKKDSWGKSKDKNKAYLKSAKLCNDFALHCNNEKSNNAENYSEVLVGAINTLAENIRKYEFESHHTHADHLGLAIQNTMSYMQNKNGITRMGQIEDGDVPTIPEMFHDNPFLLSYYYQQNNQTKESITYLDQIMENYSSGYMPFPVVQGFYRALNENPELYINEPDKRTCIAETFKNANFDFGNYDSYVLQKEKENLTEKDVNLLISSRRNGYTVEEQIFLASLPLSESNFKELYKTNHKVNFEKTKEEDEYSIENLKNDLKDDRFISFFKHKFFNLSTDDRLEFFDKIIDTKFRNWMSGDETQSFCSVLSNLFHNYDQVSESIEPELFKSKIKQFIENFLVFNDESIGAEKLHNVFVLLDEYTILNEDEKKELLEKGLSRLSTSSIEKIVKFKHNIAIQHVRETDTLNSHEEWLSNNVSKDFFEQAFYEKGDENDFRHLFYKVINGEQEITDKDRLIEKYFARNSTYIDEGEFLNFFYMQKNLDKKYLGLVCSKVQFNGTDSIINAIKEASRTGDINQETYEQIFKDLSSHAPFNVAVEMFKWVIDQNYNKAGMWDEVNSFTANIIRNLNDKDSKMLDTRVFTSLGDIIQRVNFKDYSDYFTKELLEKSLENESTQRLLVAFYLGDKTYGQNYFKKFINNAFPVELLREEFLDKFIQVENIDLQKNLLVDYLTQGDSYNIFTEFAHKNADSYIDNVLTQDNIKLYTQMFPNMNVLTEDQNKKLVNAILARGGLQFDDEGRTPYKAKHIKSPLGGLLKNKDVGTDDRDYFTHNLLDGMTRFPEYWKDHKEDIFKSAIFTDQISDTIYENVSDRNKEFLQNNPELLKNYISGAKDRKDLNIYQVLVNISRIDGVTLPKTESQELWKLHLSKKPFDEYSYNFYIQSMDRDKTFEITQDEFNKNIELFLSENNKIYGRDHLPMLNFLTKQREFKNDQNIISLQPDQEKSVVGKLVLASQDDQMFRHLKYYNEEYFKESLKNNINAFGTTQLYVLLENQELVAGSEQVLIDHVIDKASEKRVSFEKLCEALTGTTFVPYIREKVSTLDGDLKTEYKGILLNNDMLDATELRGMYKDIKQNTDPREQVLSVAEIFGSLVTSPESKNLIEFLESEKINENIKQKLEDIKSFVKKYDLENKGRTIVVMQFAREFLPDREIDEVISRVADNINKYERILSRYEMANVPKYAQVSMGLEYEVTNSTAEGYKELTERDFKEDIVRLSKAARIGNGRDAIHEIATKPTTNPYLLILEMQLLHNLEYVDFNFDRSQLYQKGARGYHLTLGGATGLNVDSNVKFLQNAIIGASWGGINAGETGMRTSGGRGVSIRSRMKDDSNNKQVFDQKTNSVELRGLSIDKMEVFERTVLASYYGAVAIQTIENKLGRTNPESFYQLHTESIVKEYSPEKRKSEVINALQNMAPHKTIIDNDSLEIIYNYTELLTDIEQAVNYHDDFMQSETTGSEWFGNYVEPSEFGGEYNMKRFESVVKSIDDTMSVEEYVNNCKIKYEEFFRDLRTEFTDKFTMINNLYLKGSTSLGKGDNANASAMLNVTKLNNRYIEDKDERLYLNSSIFETLGERREGYYAVQGASEMMITHAIQRALLKFTNNMEKVLNKK